MADIALPVSIVLAEDQLFPTEAIVRGSQFLIDDGKGQRQFDFSHEPPVAQLLAASEQLGYQFMIRATHHETPLVIKCASKEDLCLIWSAIMPQVSNDYWKSLAICSRPPFKFRSYPQARVLERKANRKHIVICATGSVATLKLPEIALALSASAEIRIILSESAMHFYERAAVYDPAQWEAFELAGLSGMILTDEDEWGMWNEKGDPVLHIELRKWADMLLVCPASADMLAKMVAGVCDNLSLSLVRAWDRKKPIVLCPAMNTYMWKHPATKYHLRKLQKLGCHVVAPVTKRLACNDTGVGALAPVNSIIKHMRSAFWHAKHGKLIRITKQVFGVVLVAGILLFLLQDDDEYYIEEVALVKDVPRIPRLKVTWDV